MKTATLSMRLDPTIKSEAEETFGAFGMTLSDAVDIFLHKAIQVGGLPFDVRSPRYNAETEQAIDDAIHDRGMSRPFFSVSDVMADLNADD